MKTNLWSSAAINGFLLALITIIFTLVQTAFPISGMAAMILLWVVKLAATIGALFYFMKTIGQEEEPFTYGNAFSYGFVVSCCSNIVIACYLLLHYTIIFPNTIEKSMEAMQPMLEQYGTDISSIEKILNNLPVFLSISMIILYTIYGVIFSSILASFTKKAEEPFAHEPDL